nr:RuBisCO large subunit-binding protein subunit alpha [Tanacetum cinerariifolium]
MLNKEWRFVEDVSGDALATLVVNKLRGILNVIVIKASGFDERRKALLQDIVIVTGVEYQANDLGLLVENSSVEQHNLQHLPHMKAQALQENKKLNNI